MDSSDKFALLDMALIFENNGDIESAEQSYLQFIEYYYSSAVHQSTSVVDFAWKVFCFFL